MKNITLLVISLFISPLAIADTSSLQSQLSAIHQAESQGDAKIKIEQLKKQKLKNEQQARNTRLAEQKRKQSLIAENNRLKQRQAEQARLAKIKSEQENERLSDKYRDQEYENQLRDIEIQKQKIALQKEAARAARTNDFIDAELNKSKASTDILQSEADATRSVSKGAQNLMESEGKAREKETGGWFN
jgi:hypothetical protein